MPSFSLVYNGTLYVYFAGVYWVEGTTNKIPVMVYEP